jgi:nucleoside phosphorylase
MFICAGESEQFDFAKPIGIGLMDVVIRLTQLCMEQKPEYLHFVGSAGSYGRYEIFDIVESSSACNIENSFFNARAYSPIENNVSCETIDNEIIVNSSNYITTDSSLGKAYEARNIYLENMEFYAVAKVAKAFDIPMQGTFIITNYCNSNAHEDFLKYHQEAMSKLTTYIKEKK